MKSGETQTLAEFVGNGWSVMDNLWSFHLPNKCRDDGHLFEVTGTRTVCIYYKIIFVNNGFPWQELCRIFITLRRSYH